MVAALGVATIHPALAFQDFCLLLQLQKVQQHLTLEDWQLIRQFVWKELHVVAPALQQQMLHPAVQLLICH